MADTGTVRIDTELVAVSPIIAERKHVSVSDGVGERVGNTRGVARRGAMLSGQV